MALIGIYRVSRSDLQKPESEQTWKREAAVRTDKREWTVTSDSDIIQLVDGDELAAALDVGDDAAFEYLYETCADNSRGVFYAQDAEESEATVIVEEPRLSYLQHKRVREIVADDEDPRGRREAEADLAEEVPEPTPIPAPPLFQDDGSD